MEDREIEVDGAKKYRIPDNIVKRYIDNKVLIISVETANWIVLSNKNQEAIFEMLTKESVECVLEYVEGTGLDINDFINVLTQIEAKCFEKIRYKNFDINAICIYLTNQCNLNCRHCYMLSGDRDNGELNTEEIYKLLYNFREFKGKVVTFTGGEVTQRNDFDKIISYSKSLGLVNTVLTNGTKWDTKLIDNTYKSIDEIQISIDGYDEVSNSYIRGVNNFYTALNTASKFYEKNVKVTIAVTPALPIDEDKYAEFGTKLLMKYKDDTRFSIKFTYELIKGRDERITGIDNLEYSQAVDRIVERIYPENKKEKFVLNHKNGSLFSNCGYGGITIAPNGDVYFCNRITELKSHGNIRTNEFKEILNKSIWAKKISDVDNLYPCNKCDLKYICGGGCRLAYFPEIVTKNPYELSDCKRAMICDDDVKLSLYRRMIETNELFYY